MNDTNERPNEAPQANQRLAEAEQWMAVIKEGVTGLIGVAIVVTTLIVAWSTIGRASDSTAFQAAKDVLLFMNGLVGVVLGYYFGRMPGEARAQQAEELREQSLVQAAEARERLSGIVGGMEELQATLTEATQGPQVDAVLGIAPEEAGSVIANLQAVEARLNRLIQKATG